MKKGINVLSLFDGLSCGNIALERAGIKVDNYFACEIDKYAIQIANKNYPIFQMGDVKDLTAGVLPKIDLLIGGSPCQDLSFAGKGKGLKGDRSSLFYQYVRLLKECKPKYFLLENVRMKQEYQDIISDLLGVQPIKINSSLVSAQNRVRLYWTNIPNVTQPEDKGILLKDILEIDGYVDRDKSYCLDANYFKGGNLKSYFEKHRRQLVFNNDKPITSETTYRKLTTKECSRLQTIPDSYCDGVSNTQKYKMLGNSFTASVIAHIFKGLKDGE
jgi:DNA (cytosine-5)-methyltransferase 3A